MLHRKMKKQVKPEKSMILFQIWLVLLNVMNIVLHFAYYGHEKYFRCGTAITMGCKNVFILNSVCYIENGRQIADAFEACFTVVKHWLSVNVLCVNPVKSKLIVVGPPKHINPYDQMTLPLDDVAILCIGRVKNIGVISCLCFELHIKEVSRNVFFFFFIWETLLRVHWPYQVTILRFWFMYLFLLG